jgi:CopA family copper-resistance protein
MKIYITVLLLLFINFFIQAQHEGHTDTIPEKNVQQKSTENKVILNQATEKVNQAPGKKVVYHLYITDTLVNFTGKPEKAFAVNGTIPMPTLTFSEGDTAEIYVHNQLKEETSLHWHGLILPNQYDGVPWMTQRPIKAGTTKLYTFPIVQNGTYWYHSHTELQEQSGMYGALILKKRISSPKIRESDLIPDYNIVLSEWTDYKPENVHRMLHNATDWFAIKKNATQSYAEAIKAGYFKTKIKNEWKRMLAMDVSDVYYDMFLTNGKPETEAPQYRAGDKIRLRIINGGASTYFWLKYAGGKMTVVANDGEDVVPVEVDRLIIAVAETYDIVVTIPSDSTAFEFLATSEDRTKSTSLWLGKGIKQLASPLPRLKYFEGMKMMNGMMKMNGDLDDSGMNMSLNQMDMNIVMYPEITGDANTKSDEESTDKKMDSEMKGMDHSNHNMYNSNAMSDIVTLNYSMLRSPNKTTLPNAVTKTYQFELTGNMNRYVWTIDNKTVSEADKILIKKGENIRIIMTNNSMMRHPMHLHGHFFRVLNGQGDYAPLKNVIDLMPMETDTLEFAATESGDWFFHCHILYHMMSGMGRVFSYENSPPNSELPNKKYADRKLFKDDREFHFMFENDFATNGNDGMLMLQNTRWSIGTEWRLGYHDMHGYETETHIGRFIGKMQWLMPFIGFDWRYRKMGMSEEEENIFRQTNTKDNRAVVSAGVEYTLPMLIKAQAEVFQDGIIRLQLMREDIPLSKRLRMSFMLNTDKEYMAGFKYIAGKNIGLSTHYDSDMGIGFGLTLNY